MSTFASYERFWVHGNAISNSSRAGVLALNKQTVHPISFGDLSILVWGTPQFVILIRESLLISKITPYLKNNGKSFPLTLFLTSLLPYLSLTCLISFTDDYFSLFSPPCPASMMSCHVSICNSVGYLFSLVYMSYLTLWWCWEFSNERLLYKNIFVCSFSELWFY